MPAAAADRRRDSRHISGTARKAPADPGLGIQGSASQGCDRCPCGRRRGQHQFLGDAEPSQPQSRSRADWWFAASRRPLQWQVKDYDADKEPIAAFLERHASRQPDRALSREPGGVVRIPAVSSFRRPGICHRLREPPDQPDAAVWPITRIDGSIQPSAPHTSQSSEIRSSCAPWWSANSAASRTRALATCPSRRRRPARCCSRCAPSRSISSTW